MKKKNILLLIIVAVAVVSVLFSLTDSNDQSAYIRKIEEERKEKDHFMQNSSESPFKESTQPFTGLKYFPVDPKFNIIANLTPIENKQVVLLPTNDGKEQRYVQHAYAEFDLDGYHNKLLILELVDMGPFRGKLFLAFGDETSAGETYGAGRYLDVNKVKGSDTITLDFNLAYNPYCAYVDKFSCPLPPRENLLKIAVRAGEKIYHE